jgi:DNA modification methylase
VAGAKRGATRSNGCPGKGAKARSDVRLLEGDCLEILAAMEPESVDAIVTDPPYGLEFMGAAWDRLAAGQPRKGAAAAAAMQAWHRQWAEPAFRVLRPGGHLLAFGGTRTYHRLTCALEDAGFEIRDSIMWLYGTGFPKSLDVSKAIDAAAGARREKIGTRLAGIRAPGEKDRHTVGGSRAVEVDVTAPSTPDAARWEGWGTALKPAHEPIVVARKPLIGTVAKNVLEHGTGAINVDACRIAVECTERKRTGGHPRRSSTGRWPANVVLSHLEGCMQVGPVKVRSDGHFPSARGAGGISTDGHDGQDGLAERHTSGETVEAWRCAPGCPVAALDEQSGILVSGANPVRRKSDKFRGIYGDFAGQADANPQRGTDRGGASRFFYCAKPSRAERNAGLSNPFINDHPTVKPIGHLRWLIRLVTPPGGRVLDLFLGSGSTGCAAVLEGFDFIGVERDERYSAIAKARIEFWAQHAGQEVRAVLAQLHRSQRRRDRKVRS